jgi:hypothetical protein
MVPGKSWQIAELIPTGITDSKTNSNSGTQSDSRNCPDSVANSHTNPDAGADADSEIESHAVANTYLENGAYLLPCLIRRAPDVGQQGPLRPSRRLA